MLVYVKKKKRENMQTYSSLEKNCILQYILNKEI